MAASYESYRKSADYIKSAIGDFSPQIGLILGSGLGGFSHCIEEQREIPYSQIPGFLVSTAPGHAGKLIFGMAGGKRVVCMSGRFHYYEGYSFEQLALPVRVLKLLGIEKLVLTNAAGAVNESYNVGDIMIIRDQIKLFEGSPMRGPNVSEFGPRFFDASHLYSPALIQIAKECGEGSGLTLREGVYFYFPGPQFETPAEVRAARLLGADAVGMSTVTEALTAAHCGLPVLGLSLMTNMAAGVLDQPLTTGEVNAASEKAAPLFEAYMLRVLEKM